MILAWHDGTPHDLTETAWAQVCASFLGAGFRVDLPGGPQRPEATAHELNRVRQVAELIGADLPISDWERATTAHADADVELVGGWPRSYAGRSGTWMAALPLSAEKPITTGAFLPCPTHRRPTSGLPMFSRLADEVALAEIDADCGLWADLEGRVVTSTAGPILAQRSDGGWAMGTESSTWLASRIATERGATLDLRVDDLPAARFLAVVRRASEIQQITYVS